MNSWSINEPTSNRGFVTAPSPPQSRQAPSGMGHPQMVPHACDPMQGSELLSKKGVIASNALQSGIAKGSVTAMFPSGLVMGDPSLQILHDVKASEEGAAVENKSNAKRRIVPVDDRLGGRICSRRSFFYFV